MEQAFSSDLSHEQWKFIEPLLPKARPGGRPRKTCLRSVVNAIFYLNRTGCQWRYLPRHFPPWQTVYDYYAKWVKVGLWYDIQIALYFSVRVKAGRKAFPTLAIVDAQSMRAARGERRAADHFKKVIGRKRTILVDTLGFIISCHVHKANDQDFAGFEVAFEKLPTPFKTNLQKIVGDLGYRYEQLKYQTGKYGIEMEAIDRRVHGTNMVKKRWIVERSFAWFNGFRRLGRDYECTTKSSEASLYISQIQLLLKRLCLCIFQYLRLPKTFQTGSCEE